MNKTTTPYKERLLRIKRRYWEVFGDLEAQAEHLKILTLSLLFLLTLSLIGGYLLARKPPVVIRVTEAGSAEPIGDLKTHNAPTEPEILHFAKTFTTRYTAHNAYTLSRDIAEAFNMMTSKLLKRVRRAFLDSGELARVKEAGLHIDIEFKEAIIQRNTANHIVVSLVGVRTIKSYESPDFKESNLFKAELILVRVPRREDIPHGLLVAEYHDMILNQLEGGAK